MIRSPKSGSRRRVVVPLAGALLVGLAACGTDTPAAVAIPNVFDLSYDPTSAIPAVDPQRENVMSADRLRNQLEKEFTWHGITLTQVMRRAHAGDSSVQAWIEELTGSTDDITAVLGLVYGREAASAFNQQWSQHTQFLVDYAVAIAAGDADGADTAREQLSIYAIDSGSFFAEVTDNGLPADAVAGLLDTHVMHMIDMIEAVDRGDVPDALDVAIEDNEYLATIAQGLATAMVATQGRAFPGTIETPEALYCSIITTETGNYLLRELFIPSDATASAAVFQQATGVSLGEVIGVIDQLQATDASLAAQTADLALDRAFDHARPPTP